MTIVALVAGATRGAGRGIAEALGEIGAVVYCTGRSSSASASVPQTSESPFALEGRPETIEETAAIVTKAGGQGIAVRTDHTDEDQIARLMKRIARDHGRLDLLVNDIWGGETLVQWGKPFEAIEVEPGAELFDRAILTHIRTTKHAVALLAQGNRPLIVEVTDGDALHYRSSIFYDLIKTAVIRLAFVTAESLRDRKIGATVVTPGFLRSEAMLEHMKITEDDWKRGAEQDEHFLFSESPLFVGRGIAALTADSKRGVLGGEVWSSWALANRYDLYDRDGSRPDWGAHAAGSDFGQDQVASHARFLANFNR